MASMKEMLTGRPRLNRVVNRRLILDRIRRLGKISRAELAELTAIRPPTVSAVIKELIDEGLVEEIGNGESRGGRAPRMLALSGRKTQAMGFEVSETAILAGICDLRGKLTARMRVEASPSSPDVTVSRLRELGDELLAGMSLEWDDIQGVGLALPGHMNAGSGIIRWSKPLGWQDVPLRKLAEDCWGVETHVVNDSVAGGMASHFLGAGKDFRTLVYMYLRFNVIEAHTLEQEHGVIGMGCGIIINGEPFHGEFGAAGEITTLVKHPLVDALDDTGQPFRNVDAFVEALHAGRASAVAAMDRVAGDMAHLVVHAVNFLEPGMFVLGSDNSPLRDALLIRLQRILDEHRLLHEAGKTKLVASTLGEYGVVRGAVVPVLQRVFRMPRWT